MLLAERWILARLRNARFLSLADLNAAISAMAKAGKFDEITVKYPQLVGKMTLPKAN